MPEASPSRLVAPVLQAGFPSAANDVPGPLRQVALDVACDTLGVLPVGIGPFVAVLAEHFDDVAATFMARAFAGTIDLLPDWARRMHGLANPLLGRPLVRAGTLGVARTLRWAFR